MKALELVRKVVGLGAKMRAGGGAVALIGNGAGVRAIRLTTLVARRLQDVDIPPPKPAERLVLTVAASQLRALADTLLPAVTTNDAAPEQRPREEERSREKERSGEIEVKQTGEVAWTSGDLTARRDAPSALERGRSGSLEAALAELVAETLALVDKALCTAPEIDAREVGSLPEPHERDR